MAVMEGNNLFCVVGDCLLDSSKTILIRYLGGGSSLIVPASVEVLGPSCFSYCRPLLSIRFEKNPRLKRIEPNAYSYSSVNHVTIPKTVISIDGSAFSNVTGLSIAVEHGNQAFDVEANCLVDISKKIILRYFGQVSSVTIGRNVEILGSFCFSYCRSKLSVNRENVQRHFAKNGRVWRH
jgi:hypothetical protein